VSQEELAGRLYKIESLVGQLKEEIEKIKFFLVNPSSNSIVLSLPDHLRKTYTAVMMYDRVTADDVSEVTKRARAVESSYLNQLVTMGQLTKGRNGRKVYFGKK